MVVSNILILLFTVASYFFGAKAIVENRYRPNVFSRIIWLLVALNGLASVILLKNSSSIILFAVLGFLGSFLIFVLSLREKASFGLIELISTVLLLLSLALWFFVRIPFLNLTIGLVITFIGGVPTYIKALKDPYDENIPFWLFFTLASLVTLYNSDRSTLSGYLFPLYFLITNAGMTLLCLRRFVKSAN